MPRPATDQKRFRQPVVVLAPYLLSVALVALATLLTKKTQPVVQEVSPLFFAAVMISTWVGGLGPALVATTLAGFASAYFFYDIPAGTGAFGWDDALRLCGFLMVALLMSWLMYLRQLAEQSLHRANDLLEFRVRERTQELETSMRLVVESEERFRILMEGVADYAICMLDMDGRVMSWNPGSERIHGYREREILGKPFEIFYTPVDRVRKLPAAHLQHAVAGGRHEDEGWRIRQDGREFSANVIITPLRDAQGTLRGFAHITRDITAIKQLERQVLEISDKEQQRIGQDLHDGLGQELTGLAFLSQNLGKRLAARSLTEDAEEAQRFSMLVSRTIEQTRELARGLTPVELGSDGLVAALRNLTDQARKMHRIPLALQLDENVRVNDHTAAVHLYRISQEAITNAARHAGAAGIWVSLRDVDREIVVTVEDDGQGISSDSATSTGLGLRLMLYRARMIGASLTIGRRDSNPAAPRPGTIVRCVYRNVLDNKEPRDGAPTPNDPKHTKPGEAKRVADSVGG